MQKPTTSDPSFKNFIEGLKNTNVSAVGPRPVQVDQLQPQSEVVGSQTEGLNTLYKEEKDANKEQKEFYKLQKQHNLIQENQFKQIVKSLENLNKLFSAKADVENKANKVEYKGLPDQAKDLTYSEVLKQGVAKVKGVGSSVKSMGKSIVSAFKDPASTVKSLYSNVKGSTKSMVENVKDIASTKENYTPEQERFAKAYAASAKGTQFQKGGKSALDAGSDKYDALKAKQEEINVVKEKMDVPASQGFDPLKKDVKELAKLENQFASIDPRVKKEEVLNNKVNTEVVKKERESEVTGGVGADKPVTVNQESDNVVSAPEAVAEGTKADLEVSKQLLETTREQLTVLKEIKEALAPETPNELTEQKSAPSATEKEGGGGGGSLLDTAMDLGGDLLGKGKGAPGKGIPKGAGKPSLGSRVKGLGSSIKGAGSSIFKGAGGLFSAGGAVAAATTIGGGLALNYGLTKGADAITEAAGADTNVTPEMEAQDQANWDKASFFEKAQSGVARGIEGVGGFLGADKTVAAAKAARIKSETEYLKSNEAEAKPVETVIPTETVTGNKLSPAVAASRARWDRKAANIRRVNEETRAGTYKTDAEKAGIIPGGGQITDPNAPGYNADAAEYQRGKEDIKAEAKPAETAAGKKDVVSKETVDGKKAEYAGDIKATNTEAKLKVFGKGGSKEYSSFEEMGKALKNKEITPAQHRNAIKFFQKDNPEAYQKELERREKKDVTAEAKPAETAAVVPAKTTPVGANVARTSTENADMGREASKGGANNTVVSNNVSTNNTTTHVPIKATPRAESQGSALDRYQNRVSSFG